MARRHDGPGVHAWTFAVDCARRSVPVHGLTPRTGVGHLARRVTRKAQRGRVAFRGHEREGEKLRGEHDLAHGASVCLRSDVA